jgi:hypothetical protein
MVRGSTANKVKNPHPSPCPKDLPEGEGDDENEPFIPVYGIFKLLRNGCQV